MMAPMATAKTNQRTTKTNGFLKKGNLRLCFPLHPLSQSFVTIIFRFLINYSCYLKELSTLADNQDEEIFYEVTKKIIVPAIFCIIATIHTVVSPVVDVPGPGYSVTYYE